MFTEEEKTTKLKDWFKANVLDKHVVKQTLGIEENHVSPAVLLAASKKLMDINKGTSEPDDRDNLRYSHFAGIEDMIKEHIEKDAGRHQRKAAFKMQQKKNLSWLHSNFFDPQIRSVVVGNPLSQNMEGINPLEFFDTSHRVTKLGPGGIPSIDAIPLESRQVNPSAFGFFDPLHVTEGENIGVTNYVAGNTLKGKDGRLYKVMKTKTGKLEWVDHEKVLNSLVHIPEY